MSDTRLIKSDVWHGEEYFYVSTIERDSSAMLGPRRFVETIVWRFNREKNERGDLVFTAGASWGISKHFNICKHLFERGLEGLDETEN